MAEAARHRTFLDPLRSAATVASVLLVSLVFVLGLVTFLGYFKFESSLTTIAERRIALIADEARGSIEMAMRLGLKLEDIQAVRGVVEGARARDPRVRDIYVFSTDTGRNVFSSDPAAIDAEAEHAWLAAQAASSGGSWRIQSGEEAVVGRRLDSNLATGIGGVVIVYSLADILARIEAMRTKLILAAATTFAVFSVIALAGAMVVTRGYRHTVQGLADAIAADGEPAASSAEPLPDSLRSSVDRFHEAAREAGLQLDRLEAALALPADGDGPKLAAIR